MREFKTWKQLRAMSISLAQEKSLSLFLKGEIPDSRSVVSEVMKQKPRIDVDSYRLDRIRLIKQETNEM